MNHSAQSDQQDPDQSVRADVWLWAVRLFKTRSQSAEACRAGRIRMNGQNVKPARQVRPGDTLDVEKNKPLVQTVRVRALLTRRVGAKLVDDYMEDLTTEETYARAAEARKSVREAPGPTREEGSGRPTKKERRSLDDALNETSDRESFYRALDRQIRKGSAIVAALLLGFAASAIAEDPPKRRFTTAEGAPTFKITENLHISAKNLAPETDQATGAFKGMAATGRVLIKVRQKANDDWILISCGKATYDPAKDLILLTRFPSVKAKGQVLRATSDKTYVKVERKTGKWEIDGPHKLELNLDALKDKIPR